MNFPHSTRHARNFLRWAADPMPPLFPLESVLRLRRSQQRQQELVLQRKSREVMRLRLELANARAETVRISTLSPDGRTAAEIQFDQERLGALSLRSAQIAEALRQAIAARDQSASEFRQAWQRRETLETLQNRAREAYAIDESRRAQRALDDWFLSRKSRF